MNYFIKKEYVENINSVGEVIKKYTQPPIDKIWQIDAYKYISKAISKESKVLELGCGSGWKLTKYIGKKTRDITGIDYNHAIKYCKSKYNLGKWITEDFDNPGLIHSDKYDFIISIDVIEHLVNPENLIERIKINATKNTIIYISTPERDIVRGIDHLGPSPNLKHVREWNKEEFALFLKSQNLIVHDILLLNANKRSFRQWFYHFRKRINNNSCQLAICQLN